MSHLHIKKKEINMEVSIIIPVYNKETYIRQCLTQALSQDYDDYEVIAVDDGSKDSSGAICDEMASDNLRLKVIHMTNGGVTAARRKGVEEACGKYIMFCDSDDALMPHALRLSIEAIKATDADEVIAPYQNQDGVVNDSGCRGLISSADIIKDFLALRNNFPPIWGILLRRDIILDGCLDIPREVYLGEDILFHIRYLTKISKVYCLDKSSYIYHQGLSTYPKITLDYEKQYDQLLRESLQPIWDDIKSYFILYQIKRYEKYLDKRQFQVLKDYYAPLRKQTNKDIPFKDRLAIKLPPQISYLLIHVYKQILEIIKRRKRNQQRLSNG